jgi:hypothetical protein
LLFGPKFLQSKQGLRGKKKSARKSKCAFGREKESSHAKLRAWHARSALDQFLRF